MLGIVGDLGSQRVIAWEISSEMDISAFEKEVKSFLPSFFVKSLDSDMLRCGTDNADHGCLMSDFMYLNLFGVGYLQSITNIEFFKKFNRTF